MRDRSARTILFVDDQPEITAALEVAFHKKPYSVLTAGSGAEALEVLSRTHVDAVVSDERMPRMSGSQLLTIVRRDYPDAVRIILSGHANFDSTLAAINDARADRFLVKPCSPEEIELSIANGLDERHQRSHDEAQKRLTSEVARVQAQKEFEAALDMLWIAFQPVVRSDSQVFAYEALARSYYPELGSPYLLFQAAELFNRVEELELRILDLIAARIAELPEKVQVMVNISPRVLTNESLYSTDSRLFPFRARVIFEITERDRLQDMPGAEDNLARLRNIGYRVAVDDLGAGYAGLNSFALIRPDLVKFDRELIRDIHNSPTKSDLVRLIAAFCKDTGILTVAEGIETSEEYAAVRSLGCDLLQGFYIALPSREFVCPAALDEQSRAPEFPL